MDAATREKRHQRMLSEIAHDARDTARWTGRDAFSEGTMTAMEVVRRHLFVDPADAVAGYVNRPLRIGCGQTISQPFIVALMTDFLNLAGDETILEIGTGSGYQAAVLASIVEQGHVYSLEVVEALAKSAKVRLAKMGYDNVTVRHGDGYEGWLERAPYDAIIVTAAPEHLPDELSAQLKPGGRMIMPIGRVHDHQMLTLIRKPAESQNGDYSLRVDKVLPVAFVPMVKRGIENTQIERGDTK